jgi:hypothetical protein
MRPYDQELLTCQRYWSCSNPGTPKGAGTGLVSWEAMITSALAGTYVFPRTMRVSPTVTVWQNGVSNQVRNSGTGGVLTLSPSGLSTSSQGVSVLSNSTAIFAAGNMYDFDLIMDARL